MYIPPDWISSRGFFMKAKGNKNPYEIQLCDGISVSLESPSQDACPFMGSKLKSHLDF